MREGEIHEGGIENSNKEIGQADISDEGATVEATDLGDKEMRRRVLSERNIHR